MSAAGQPQQKRVLVIDDDPAVLDLLRSVLGRKSIDVATCKTGADALTTIASSRFDVVLLDLGLPDIRGLELIPKLRELAPGVRIAIITGDTTSESVLGAIREQAFEYIRKPFDIHEVVDIVQRATTATVEPSKCTPPSPSGSNFPSRACTAPWTASSTLSGSSSPPCRKTFPRR
jgi:DNA-binding NtrC family response regulator